METFALNGPPLDRDFRASDTCGGADVAAPLKHMRPAPRLGHVCSDPVVSLALMERVPSGRDAKGAPATHGEPAYKAMLRDLTQLETRARNHPDDFGRSPDVRIAPLGVVGSRRFDVPVEKRGQQWFVAGTSIEATPKPGNKFSLKGYEPVLPAGMQLPADLSIDLPSGSDTLHVPGRPEPALNYPRQLQRLHGALTQPRSAADETELSAGWREISYTTAVELVTLTVNDDNDVVRCDLNDGETELPVQFAARKRVRPESPHSSTMSEPTPKRAAPDSGSPPATSSTGDIEALSPDVDAEETRVPDNGMWVWLGSRTPDPVGMLKFAELHPDHRLILLTNSEDAIPAALHDIALSSTFKSRGLSDIPADERLDHYENVVGDLNERLETVTLYEFFNDPWWTDPQENILGIDARALKEAVDLETTQGFLCNEAAGSDILRMALLYRHGGLYMDFDVHVHSTFPPLHAPYGILVHAHDSPQGPAMGNGVMGATQGSAFVGTTLMAMLANYAPSRPIEQQFRSTAQTLGVNFRKHSERSEFKRSPLMPQPPEVGNTRIRLTMETTGITLISTGLFQHLAPETGANEDYLEQNPGEEQRLGKQYFATHLNEVALPPCYHVPDASGGWGSPAPAVRRASFADQAPQHPIQNEPERSVSANAVRTDR